MFSRSDPEMYNKDNNVSHRFKVCCISFLVQPGRIPGIKMFVCAPGISSKNNNIHKTTLVVLADAKTFLRGGS